MRTVLLLLAIVISSSHTFGGFVDYFSSVNIEEESGQLLNPLGFEVKFSKFKSLKKATENSPMVIIMPPTGGRNDLDTAYARKFARNGFEALILESWTDQNEYSLDLGVHNRYIDRALNALHIIVSHFNDREVHFLGTSAGGIYLNIFMGTKEARDNKNIKSYFSIVSSDKLCATIARANEKALKEIRQIRMKAMKLDRLSDYEELICNSIDFKIPQNLPDHIRFGQLIAEKDSTVPTEFQYSLKEKWFPQQLEVLKKNHIGAIIKSYWCHSSDILSFFIDSTNES